MLVADEAADITAAITTAVTGVTSPLPSGVKRSATNSSEPLRKNTSAPSSSAGTSSNALTSSGHTSALSTPKAPAPTAAVAAIWVGLSPFCASMRKSGRSQARTARVAEATIHTASTRPTARSALRPAARLRLGFRPG